MNKKKEQNFYLNRFILLIYATKIKRNYKKLLNI